MRRDNDFSRAFQDKTDCWQRAVDSMWFGDFAVSYGNVEINAHKHRFAAQIQVDEFSNHKISGAIYGAIAIL
jgi:hypothetical protein